MLNIKDIVINDGRIPGLPANPRIIRDHRFEKLKKSIIEFPEMLALREVIVFPFEKKYVAIAGNMRLEACRALEHKEVAVKVLPDTFPIEKLRELAIKDNVQFGEDDFDLLANEWTDFQIEDWGMELPEFDAFAPNLDPETSRRKISADDIVKTEAELNDKYQGGKNYLEVTCPTCAETFFINPD